jgi:Holliday junction resolvasome RuvABC ATP-dependent DNA helicase subunit
MEPEMTELEKAQRDAAHARDELRIATMLLARVRGFCEADALSGKPMLPSEAALFHDICKFMRRTSLFPANAE